MTSRDFCYWLQGFFEIAGSEITILNTDQIDMIKRHLALVFKHEIDPSYGDEEHQAELQQIHDGPSRDYVPVTDDLQRAHEPAPPGEIYEKPPIGEEEIRRILQETADTMDRERGRGFQLRPGREPVFKC